MIEGQRIHGSIERTSPDGFIHLNGCTIYQCADIATHGQGPHLAVCSCGAADSGDDNVLGEAIEGLP